jgi:hypothetical protein
VDYVRVAVRDGLVEPLATSGASILVRRHGRVVLSSCRDSEGYAEGTVVTVHSYD